MWKNIEKNGFFKNCNFTVIWVELGEFPFTRLSSQLPIP
jgi:hypothetical protein